MKVEERIKIAEAGTNTEPTEAQKLRGNYKKGKVSIRGFLIAIENPVGSIRRGKDPDGKRWEVETKNTYGYFVGTRGKDNDGVDVYLGQNLNTDTVFIIDQVNPNTGEFDEHKVMFGFDDAKTAKKAYLSNFKRGWKGFGYINPIPFTKIRQWLYNKKATRVPFNTFRKKAGLVAAYEPKVQRIELSGEVVEGTLANLKSQAGNDFDVLIVEIISHGGNVLEGLEIMFWLSSLMDAGKHVISITTANAYSIASLIALMANERYISEHGEIMVHDPMVPEIEYANATELEQTAQELRELESYMREVYTNFTGLPDEKIQELMGKETFITPTEAVEYGFADDVITGVKKKPYSVAEAPVQERINSEIKNMSKVTNLLKKTVALLNGAEVVDQTYHTASGETIEVFQNDPATYKTGDRVSVESGEYGLADGSTITVEDYVITKIDRIGEEPKVEEVVPVEPAPVAEETAIVEEADEAPVAMDEATKVEVLETEEVKAEFNEGSAPKTEEIIPVAEAKPDMSEALMAKLDEMANSVNELKETVDSMKEETGGFKAQFEKIDKEAVDTATAIYEIASKTASSFTGDVKKAEAPEPTGTIFQQMKQRADQANQSK